MLAKSQIYTDILAGITAGVVALPLALAFGTASGLGAAAGMYGAIVLGFFAAIFGGTKTQISGPTTPMTVMIATVVASLAAEPGLIIAAFVLAGLFQILFGILKLGQYIQHVPNPVISGFISGIGVIIILLQIDPLLGLHAGKSILFSLSQANPEAMLLAGITIAIIYILPRFINKVPAMLVALLVGTVISVLFTFDVKVIGQISAAIPTLHIPDLSIGNWSRILLPGITLALLGALDSLLTSLVADRLSGEKHNSNQELIGQGIGNVAAALVGGIPGAGATMRTVVNINAGGRGRLSGVVHALVLLLVLVGLGPVVSYIPMAVLAGVLITVGISIIDFESLRNVRAKSLNDFVVQLTVFLLTVFANLLLAVAIGLVLSAALSRIKQYRISKG